MRDLVGVVEDVGGGAVAGVGGRVLPAMRIVSVEGLADLVVVGAAIAVGDRDQAPVLIDAQGVGAVRGGVGEVAVAVAGINGGAWLVAGVPLFQTVFQLCSPLAEISAVEIRFELLALVLQT